MNHDLIGETFTQLVTPLRQTASTLQTSSHGTLAENNHSALHTVLQSIENAARANEIALTGIRQQGIGSLHNLAHDWLTPSSVLIGYCDYLLDDDISLDPSPLRAALRQLMRDGYALRDQIFNLIYYARIQINYWLPRRDFILKHTALYNETAIMRCENRIEHRPMSGTARVRGVELYTQHIIICLLRNACDHTAGTVQLHSTHDQNGTTITVQDNGPGLPHDHDHLFRAFTRSHTTHPGLGLGLYLADAYARYLGADLTLAARQTGGSIFTLHLPSPSEL